MAAVARRIIAPMVAVVFIALLAIAGSFAHARQGDGDAIPIAGEAGTISHTFRFDTSDIKPRPHGVDLVGSFNHFSHTENPMQDDGQGVFTVTLQLSPDVYHYKFLADGTRWFTDPAADKTLEDKADHDNSGVLIGADARQLPPPVPNHIEPRGLAHNPENATDCDVASASLVRLRVRTQAHDVQKVTALFRTDSQSSWQRQELFAAGNRLGFEYFGGVIDLPDGSKADGDVHYLFELTDGTDTRYLASGALYAVADTAEQHPYSHSLSVSFQTPDWAKHAVWYQIFPERFRNGDPSNDPPHTLRWTSQWYETLPSEAAGEENFYKGESNVFKRRYGGDIQGIRAELPYLRSLGVNAIYLNPIFQADSLHKYDTRDYRHVDDHFGVANSTDELTGETEDPGTWKWSASDKVFLDFVADAHRQGFKVIIDGVFNHVGKSHPFFQDVVRNGRSSPYADWFVIYDWGKGGPVGKPGGMQYQAWEARNGSLPIWKKDPKLGIVHGPREHIMAITRRWLAPDGDVSRGVDGFRLDAANEIPHPFWVDWRKLVKSINPDAYIDGEIWSWAQPWLKGDQFDAVMNYQFAMASQSFFVDHKRALTPTEFSNRLDELFYNYPLQVVLAQQNLYDSHDTDRFASRFLNPDIGYNQHDRLQEAGSKYNAGQPTERDWARDRQAVAFQMCFAGAPMVYYGDEAGMWSPSDPSDRMPMWWKDLEPFDDPQYRFNQKEFEWYQRCIAVHRQLSALQVGSYHPIAADDQQSVFAFARDLAKQTAYVVLNRSSSTASVEVPVDGTSPKLIDWMNSDQVTLVPSDASQGRPSLRVNSDSAGYPVEGGKVHLTLPAFGTAVLAPVPVAEAAAATLPAVQAQAETVQREGGWSLRVDPKNGDYEVTANNPAWTVGGTIGKPLDKLTADQGQDHIGPYHLISFSWQEGGRRSGSIRIYQDRPLALFNVKFEDSVNGSPAAFPVLSKLPANLMAFRYGETDHLRPELFHLAGSQPDEQYGGPFCLFDDQANTMILSPASNFMVAMMSGDLHSGLSSGLNRTLTGVSAGYEQQTLLAIGPGINHTWDTWGHGLTDLYAKQRPANDADTGLKYLGYWTDNGSHYYYNYDSEKGYIGTLLAVKDYLLKHEIPIHYMQLDSWWYPKTFDSVQKKESNKPRSKDPKLPPGSWNRYGGLLEFTAAKELFPQGLGGFQQQLGLPLIVHNRWIDPKSPYRETYKVSGIAAVDPLWWKKIASDISKWGVITYEQDWNNYIYLKSPELMSSTWAGDAYMDGMAHACADHNLTMQYCMVMPRFLLQGGAKYPNLTTVRVSGDRFDRGKWHEFLYGSTLAGALGVWPWTDVYHSSETSNILISTLSAGMVGLSDQMGDEDAENIFHAVRKDGVIVKPDMPLTPTDASFIAEAHDAASGAVVCATSSNNQGQTAWYIFAFTREHKKPSPTKWTLNPQALGMMGTAIAYDFFNGKTETIDDQHPLTSQLDKEHDWAYRVLVPVGRSGMALVGDTGLFVTRGRQRIASVEDDGNVLHTTVLLARGESAVTLAVYSPSQPIAEVKNGSAGSVAYDANTRIAKIQVKSDAAAPGPDAVPLDVTFHLR